MLLFFLFWIFAGNSGDLHANLFTPLRSMLDAGVPFAAPSLCLLPASVALPKWRCGYAAFFFLLVFGRGKIVGLSRG